MVGVGDLISAQIGRENEAFSCRGPGRNVKIPWRKAIMRVQGPWAKGVGASQKEVVQGTITSSVHDWHSTHAGGIVRRGMASHPLFSGR